MDNHTFSGATAPEIAAPGNEAMLAAAKRLDTVRARLALRGHTLDVVGRQGGETMFLVSAWGNSRTLASVDEVETFADIVSGAPT